MTKAYTWNSRTNTRTPHCEDHGYLLLEYPANDDDDWAIDDDIGDDELEVRPPS